MKELKKVSAEAEVIMYKGGSKKKDDNGGCNCAGTCAKYKADFREEGI